MRDLVVIAWNILKKRDATLAGNPAFTAMIVGAIANAVRGGSAGYNTPFVAVLLEIVEPAATVGAMATHLANALSAATGVTIHASHINLGGAAHTRESAIVLHNGVTLALAPLDVRGHMQAEIAADIAQAVAKLAAHKLRTAHLRQRKTSVPPGVNRYHPYPQADRDRYRDNDKPASWFRNGAVAQLTLKGRTVRIGAVHNPGPAFTEAFAGIMNAVSAAANTQNIDYLIGDFNKHGEIAPSGFYDTSALWLSGTTVTATRTLSDSRRDRSMIRVDAPFVADLQPPMLVAPAVGQPLLTDHALIYSYLAFDPANGFALNELSPESAFFEDSGWSSLLPDLPASQLTELGSPQSTAVDASGWPLSTPAAYPPARVLNNNNNNNDFEADEEEEPENFSDYFVDDSPDVQNPLDVQPQGEAEVLDLLGSAPPAPTDRLSEPEDDTLDLLNQLPPVPSTLSSGEESESAEFA
ncbi:MAG: hypothetical protein WC804_01825 [Sphingomonas sp.]|jgi:hypothetical protein|uniref:hypothetical protein n=1 Tax=Sphingomonas sp. TaxID=28214 RepID=UPI003568951F